MGHTQNALEVRSTLAMDDKTLTKWQWFWFDYAESICSFVQLKLTLHSLQHTTSVLF